MTTETTKTVYVGGFSNDTNPSLLHSAFTPFGEILDIQLPPDPSHQQKHRGFAFVSYSNATAALDAIDNMHRNVLPGPSNANRTLKVNMAKPPKGLTVGGSNRAISARERPTMDRKHRDRDSAATLLIPPLSSTVWTDESWIKEHGQAPVGEHQVGTEGGASAQIMDE
ncbi:hypothetical protein P7C70_g8819, partial [Phenoliferia sp. Uapishka_3]